MRCIWFLLPVFHLSAMLIGNPAQPGLQKKGILNSCPSWWSFRLSYFEDYVYRQRFQDEFKTPEFARSKTISKFSTDAGQITLNFLNRLDLYAIVGGSKIKLDQEVFSSRRFAWGTGLKLVIFHGGRLWIGTDIKYFETDQRPIYFISDNLPFNIRSHFILQYSETQASLGAAFKTGPLVPYIYATYLITKISPQPPTVFVRLPFMNLDADVVMKSVIGQRRFGMALGATLVDCRRGTLALEGRFFNQNSIDVNVEVRF